MSNTNRRSLAIRRVRTIQAIVATALLVTSLASADQAVIRNWFFWAGVSTIVAVAILEPYFTGSRAALVFGIGALGASFSAERLSVEDPWSVYRALAIAVIASGAIVEILGEGRLRSAGSWLSTRLGRPLLLGVSALAIEIIRVYAIDSDAGQALAIGTFLVILVTWPDWYRLLAILPAGPTSLATVERAIHPNMLLVSTNERFNVGDAVQVDAESTASGVVVSTLAHRSGARIQIALDTDWTNVATSTGSPCIVERVESEPATPVAFAAQGSTERTLSLHPVAELRYGTTVYWERDSTQYLYQITGMSLGEETWDSSVALESRVEAIQLGAIDASGELVFEPRLPAPYQPLLPAAALEAEVPADCQRLGVVSGTQIEFGLKPDRLRGHHLAILGMSGMGKSTVANRICELMASGSMVVAVDGTTEYKNKFGLDTFDITDPDILNGEGLWVHEPKGQPSEQAMKLLGALMTHANGEYTSGQPHDRFVLIEEAHTYLPEWNFNASKNESNWVSQSCRYILQARKFGLNFAFVSQRTAVISKSALSQCESYIIFRTLDGTSLDYIESLVGPELAKAATSLSRHQALCVGPAFNTSGAVIVNFDPPA